jgi:hypothetical protein
LRITFPSCSYWTGISPHVSSTAFTRAYRTLVVSFWCSDMNEFIGVSVFHMFSSAAGRSGGSFGKRRSIPTTRCPLLIDITSRVWSLTGTTASFSGAMFT